MLRQSCHGPHTLHELYTVTSQSPVRGFTLEFYLKCVSTWVCLRNTEIRCSDKPYREYLSDNTIDIRCATTRDLHFLYFVRHSQPRREVSTTKRSHLSVSDFSHYPLSTSLPLFTTSRVGPDSDPIQTFTSRRP